MKTYTHEKADKIFNENAVLIGDKDVIPVNRAVLLLGGPAVDFAKKFRDGYSGYGLGERDAFAIKYLKKEGFYRAVTYYNINAIREEERGLNGKD